MTSPESGSTRGKGMKTVLWSAAVIGLLLAYFGWFRPRRDVQRMDAIAAAVRQNIKQGMTASDAVSVLDRLGLGHSDIVSTAHEPGAANFETPVIYSMIEHKAHPLSLVFRDVQVRIYFNEKGKVVRAEIRDVFTGP